MSDDAAISEHYVHGDLLGAIKAALVDLGKTVDNVTIEDLAPVDEFHIGGRLATEGFMAQLDYSGQGHVLDVGCGLGGASRFVAQRYKNYVTGIDLTQEYIDTGNALCAWVRLDNFITLQQGSAMSMPFAAASFDGAYMMHVGMNIVDKAGLFAEIFRVLRPGAFLGIYDVMREQGGDISYPVPWAADENSSALATSGQYRQALVAAGFAVAKETGRRDFAVDFFTALRDRTEANGGPPALGLHTLMKETTAEKIRNMIGNIAAGYIAPVEMIAFKR